MDFPSVPTSDTDVHHVDNRHVFEGEVSSGAPRRMRIRPTPKQREELERLFEMNTHPSREEREALGNRIGMYVGDRFTYGDFDPLLTYMCSWLLIRAGGIKASPTGFKICARS